MHFFTQKRLFTFERIMKITIYKKCDNFLPIFTEHIALKFRYFCSHLKTPISITMRQVRLKLI